jgi:hypothetical protein
VQIGKIMGDWQDSQPKGKKDAVNWTNTSLTEKLSHDIIKTYVKPPL